MFSIPWDVRPGWNGSVIRQLFLTFEELSNLCKVAERFYIPTSQQTFAETCLAMFLSVAVLMDVKSCVTVVLLAGP